MSNLIQIKDSKGKIGYERKDTHEVVVVPQFDEGMCSFGIDSYGKTLYATVRLNSKFGIINEKGEIVVPIEFEEAYYLFDNLFAVRRDEENDKWAFAVINDKGLEVVPFEYEYINHLETFIRCFRKVSSQRKDSFSRGKMDSKGRVYEYSPSLSFADNEIWFNQNGKKIHNGKGKVLSCQFLAACSNDRWGVFNQNGERIVNYLYDEIKIIQDKLIVSKDGKIGVLDEHGFVFITPSYANLECVSVQEGLYIESIASCVEKYGKYNKECIFDTGKNCKESTFYHKKIEIDKSITISGHSNHYNFDNIFILTVDGYSELFSVKDGILPLSRYDEIRILTNTFFAVLKEGKWGILSVVDRDVKLVISCDYDRIVFEGGDVVLLCLNNLWGAKSFKGNVVEVPAKFQEIKMLNDDQTLFGVKKNMYETDSEDSSMEYTIVDNKGEIFKKMDEFCGLQTQCVVYDLNRILTSRNGKWGFVSAYGYVSIPFKYEEILKREDNLFDVRIKIECEDEFCCDGIEMKDAWGVLSITGKEVVSVKYNNRIPLNWSGTIVVETMTGARGVLSEDGTELIPTIYEHLMKKKGLYFFGHGGCIEDGPYAVNNFFSYNIRGAQWGCLDGNGKLLVNAKYDCFKIDGEYILGGRDGSFLGKGQHGFSYFEGEYDGVYDLFDFDGNLIIGGFTSFYYSIKCDLFVIGYGGKWIQDHDDYDEWGNHISYYSYHFDVENRRWIVLDKKLFSIVKGENGTKYQFPRGFLGTATRRDEDGDSENCWNIPLELCSINEPLFMCNLIVYGNENLEWVVRVSDGAVSYEHDQILVLDVDLFFFMDIYDMGSGVGIAKLDEKGRENVLIEPIEEGTFVLTYPIGGYVFGVSYNEEGKCQVKLYDINKSSEKTIIAIRSIEEDDLMDKISRGYFMITLNDESEGLSRIMLPRLDIFDDGFRFFISHKEIGDVFPPFEKKYWFANGSYMCEPDEEDNYDNDEYYSDTDCRRETWYAMTDGMYGDMPDGFDGDFDLM